MILEALEKANNALHGRINKLELESLEKEIRIGRLLDLLKEHDLLEDAIGY